MTKNTTTVGSAPRWSLFISPSLVVPAVATDDVERRNRRQAQADGRGDRHNPKMAEIDHAQRLCAGSLQEAAVEHRLDPLRAAVAHGYTHNFVARPQRIMRMLEVDADHHRAPGRVVGRLQHK